MPTRHPQSLVHFSSCSWRAGLRHFEIEREKRALAGTRSERGLFQRQVHTVDDPGLSAVLSDLFF